MLDDKDEEMDLSELTREQLIERLQKASISKKPMGSAPTSENEKPHSDSKEEESTSDEDGSGSDNSGSTSSSSAEQSDESQIGADIGSSPPATPRTPKTMILRIRSRGGHSKERQAATKAYIGQGLPGAGRSRPRDTCHLDRGGISKEHLNFNAAMKLRVLLSLLMPRGTGSLCGNKVE